MGIALEPIGWVDSPLEDPGDAPRQPDEGAPAAWLVFDERVREAMVDLAAGDRIVLVTWLDRADRSTMAVHPRSDPSRPVTGVFSTRSPDRPNPIGLHTVRILEVDGSRVLVDALEAVASTPIIDVKPALRPVSQR